MMDLPYRTSKGELISSFNKPVTSKDSTHKKVVLAKDGTRTKLIRFWAKWYSDFTKHKDNDRRERYRARHWSIKTKDWKLAYKNKLQAAYRSRKELW